MSEVKTKVKKQKIEHEHHHHDKVFIVKVNNGELEVDGQKAYERQICGKGMAEIVAREFEGQEICFLECDFKNEEDILQELKKQSNDACHVAVVFSDQPCLKGFTVKRFLESTDTCSYFGKSFVASADFVLAMTNFAILKEFQVLHNPEFLVVEDESSFLLASKIIQDEILDKLKVREVNIEESTVDFDAEIDDRAQIFSSSISGNSNIGLALIENSTVIDCIVASGVKIKNSFVKNCIVASDVINKKIENQNILGGK